MPKFKHKTLDEMFATVSVTLKLVNTTKYNPVKLYKRLYKREIYDVIWTHVKLFALL